MFYKKKYEEANLQLERLRSLLDGNSIAVSKTLLYGDLYLDTSKHDAIVHEKLKKRLAEAKTEITELRRTIIGDMNLQTADNIIKIISETDGSCNKYRDLEEIAEHIEVYCDKATRHY